MLPSKAIKSLTENKTYTKVTHYLHLLPIYHSIDKNLTKVKITMHQEVKIPSPTSYIANKKYKYFFLSWFTKAPLVEIVLTVQHY